MNFDIQELQRVTKHLSVSFREDELMQCVQVADGKPIHFPRSINDHSDDLPGGSCPENIRQSYSNPQQPYEPLVNAFFHLMKDRKRKLNMIDVGALWGLTSLIAASLFEDFEIHLFEMNPISIKALARNINANQHLSGTFDVQNILLSNVDTTAKVTYKHYTVRAGALSDRRPISALKVLRENIKSALKRMVKGEGKGDYRKSELRIATLDRYCADKKFIPDLIKIDVEGSQFEILQGARGVLTEHHPILLVEFDTPNSANHIGKSNRDVVAFLESFGYRCLWGDHRTRDTVLQHIKSTSKLDFEVNSLGIFFIE